MLRNHNETRGEWGGESHSFHIFARAFFQNLFSTEQMAMSSDNFQSYSDRELWCYMHPWLEPPNRLGFIQIIRNWCFSIETVRKLPSHLWIWKLLQQMPQPVWTVAGSGGQVSSSLQRGTLVSATNKYFFTVFMEKWGMIYHLSGSDLYSGLIFNGTNAY